MTCERRTPLSSANSCIRRVPVFQGLTEPEIEMLHEVTYQKTYDKGEHIFRDGERSETLYVLSKGIVKISKLTETGKEQIYRFLFSGDFFGQFSLLQDKTHYANAEVLETALVCHIHKTEFNRLIEQNPNMTYRFLVAVSERLYQADEWVGTISLLEVDRRLAKILCLFFQKNGDDQQTFHLPVAKKELAAWIGTTPETISRKFAHFESLGLLKSVDHHRIRILDPVGLQNLT